MNLRNASLLALIGMVLVTLLVLIDLIRDISGVLNGIVPSVAVVRSTIYTFASVTLAMFLFAFYKRQS